MQNLQKAIPNTTLLVAALLQLFTWFPCSAVAQTSSSSSAQEPSFRERYPRYRLRPGDVLDLSFPFTPEFNQTVTVQPDGFINLRGVGDLRVQDKTTNELVTAMRAAYSKILREPEINVKLSQFEKPYFVVGGEVGHPGKYDYTGDTTVTQALAIAGGFTDKSKTREVLLFRRVSDEWAEVKRIDVKKMFGKGDLSEDLHLRPGDMVLVSKSTMSKIARFIPVPSMGMYFNPLFR
jgi:polysaccharide export outer membrane protein